MRAQIIALATSGQHKAIHVAETLGCSRSHVYRITGEFAKKGRDALFDGRSGNGNLLADEEFDAVVNNLVKQSPQDYGYARPTWTRELLVIVAEEQTKIRVSLTVMGRVLQRIRARRGRPKPTVKCRLSDRQKRRRLRKIRDLLDNLPPDEVAVYEDEVDIHLNPKIGLDWMAHGQQKTVMTPGKNAKAYLAGTLDAWNGTLLWVGDIVKNSSLFVKMLEKLNSHYRDASRIHVILDNYGIHHSAETNRALRHYPRIVLHFLPPYCPDHNRIERFWQDLHANVTRNHKHTNLIDLCHDVVDFIEHASPWLPERRPGARLLA
jgi:transposase